jgi:hypothetical protein
MGAKTRNGTHTCGCCVPFVAVARGWGRVDGGGRGLRFHQARQEGTSYLQCTSSPCPTPPRPTTAASPHAASNAALQPRASSCHVAAYTPPLLLQQRRSLGPYMPPHHPDTRRLHQPGAAWWGRLVCVLWWSIQLLRLLCAVLSEAATHSLPGRSYLQAGGGQDSQL